MNLSALSEVVISDNGGGNAHRVAVAGVSASWEISSPGSFSCFAMVRDLRLAGFADDLTGRWLTWKHPEAGSWGGVITGRPVSNGVAEIAADGWASLMRGRVLDAEWKPPGQAGGLARWAVMNAGNTMPTYITIGAIDEGGEPVLADLADQDVLEDVLPTLADDGGLEWIVNFDRTFLAGGRLGKDLSARARLIEDRHITDYRVAEDAWAGTPSEVRDLSPAVEQEQRDRPLSQGTTKPRRGKHRRRHHRERGRREHWRPGRRLTIVDSGNVAILPGPEADETSHHTALPSGIGGNSLAVPQPRYQPLPSTPIELDVTNVDGCWRWLDLGNTVRITLGSVGFAGRFRVMTRGYDAESNTLSVAGEGLVDG